MIRLSKRDNWILYLDDIRNPKDGKPWTIARTVEEAQNLVIERDCPIFVSFDHDITPEKTGYDFAKWLIEKDQDGEIKIPEKFGFFIHSANPVGAKNIQNILESYLRFKEQNKFKTDEIS